MNWRGAQIIFPMLSIIIVISLPACSQKSEMVGGNMVIKSQMETLFSGRLYEPLSLGRFSFDVASDTEAFAILDRMGITLSYHLRLTPEEVAASRKDAELLSNPMIKKAFEALTIRKDLGTAIHFAKKAVDSYPSEPRYRALLRTRARITSHFSG